MLCIFNSFIRKTLYQIWIISLKKPTNFAFKKEDYLGALVLPTQQPLRQSDSPCSFPCTEGRAEDGMQLKDGNAAVLGWTVREAAVGPVSDSCPWKGMGSYSTTHSKSLESCSLLSPLLQTHTFISTCSIF